jgi:hypothetical protein
MISLPLKLVGFEIQPEVQADFHKMLMATE